jgi:PleD family two-component response regulator
MEHLHALACKLENKLEDEKVLIRLATTDELTGVYNRRAFMDFLRHEFAALLFDTNSGSAVEVVERLRNHFTDYAFEIGEEKLSLSVSIGQACIQEADDSIEEIIKRADLALYEEKRVIR